MTGAIGGIEPAARTGSIAKQKLDQCKHGAASWKHHGQLPSDRAATRESHAAGAVPHPHPVHAAVLS